jgi:acetyltransferase-like isoleucine patch superfamily enzyme
VHIAPRVDVGSYCTVHCFCVEEHLTIGSNVDLLSGRHRRAFVNLYVPIQAPSGRFQKICIGRTSWTGNSAVLMADFGEVCVISVGGVVVKVLPRRVVVVENPAKVVRAGRPPGVPREQGAT